jgi:hypothetical protein
MPEVKITFCNRAYAERWYENMQRQNPAHFDVLNAIIEEIEHKSGGEISKNDIFKRRPEIAMRVQADGFDIIPSGGQMLRRNGNGLRHAKYAKSKSIALFWELIGDIIYVTFDDHKRAEYHRAISHLRHIRLGMPALPKQARNTGGFLRTLRYYSRYGYHRRFKGFNATKAYYELDD